MKQNSALQNVFISTTHNIRGTSARLQTQHAAVTVTAENSQESPPVPRAFPNTYFSLLHSIRTVPCSIQC